MKLSFLAALGILFSMLSTYAQALPTDGNYILEQADIYGSGNTLTDGNYLLLADTGEPFTVKTSQATDYNALSAGYQSQPWLEIISAPIEEVVQKIIMMIPVREDTTLAIVGSAAIVITGVGVFALWNKKKNKVEENE
jgi:hypothetical protein